MFYRLCGHSRVGAANEWLGSFWTHSLHQNQLSARENAHGPLRSFMLLWILAAALVIGHRLFLDHRGKTQAEDRKWLNHRIFFEKANRDSLNVVGVRYSRTSAQCVDRLVLYHFGPIRGGGINLLNFCCPLDGRNLSTVFRPAWVKAIELGGAAGSHYRHRRLLDS